MYKRFGRRKYDNIQWRDIFQASMRGEVDAVKRFIDVMGVPATTCTRDNETPAHIAARNCQLKLLKYLLENYPELQKARDIFGNTVLHHATMCGEVKLIKYLILERDMDLFDVANVHLGNGPVQMAAEKGFLDVMEYFVEVKNVDVNMRNRMGQPLVFVAAANKRLHIIQYLLEKHNADMFLTDDNGDNILHISSRIGDIAVPIYLLEKQKLKFDIESRDRYGETILHQAARLNHLIFVKYFVGERNANFNARDAVGRTPLHDAAEQGHLDMVKYLMDQGASIYVEDVFGKTPIQVSDNKEVIKYLEQYVPPERKRRSASALFSNPFMRDKSIPKTSSFERQASEIA
jgi:ankyrin repeat protein